MATRRSTATASDRSIPIPAACISSCPTTALQQDLRVTDVFQKAVGADWCTDTWAYRVETVLTEGQARYLQWQFQWASSTGGGAVDCSVDSPVLTAGFEAFLSSGVSFIRSEGRNATMSMNSAGDFLIQDANLQFDANTWVSSLQFSKFNPIININSNFSQNDPLMALGGRIENVTMIQDGYISATGDTLKGIVIGPNNPNVSIIGGSYTAPDYKAGSATSVRWA